MPAKIEPVPNEPIAIVTFEGHLDVDTVRQVFVDTAVIFAQFEGDVYRIADIRTAKIGFVDLINIVKAVRGGLPASSIDPRVHGIFVGQNQFARMYADLIKQLGGTPIPIFATMEDALEYIELERQKQT
ncbi:MAG: hypothetical protein GC179_01240 [Anaerolineaceae bacterium]|nr:hypothetical protein [Anaerolineaceae bacterium]